MSFIGNYSMEIVKSLELPSLDEKSCQGDCGTAQGLSRT